MKLTEIRDYLLENAYIQEENREYAFTPNFYRDLQQDTRKELSDKLSPAKRLLSEADLFKRFLEDARVPKFQQSKDGGTYVVGAFSKTAAKAFNQIMNRGYNYERLCAATALYYRQTSYCTTVQKFLTEGLWETYYEQCKDGEMPGDTPVRTTNKTLG